MISRENNPDYLNSFLDYSVTILNKSPNSIKEYNYDIAMFLKFIKLRFKLTNEDDRLNKIIEESDYLLFSEGFKNQREKLLKMKEEIKKEQDTFNKQEIITKIENSIKEEMEKIANGGEFNKENLSQLIKRIEIDKDKNIIINYNFIELNCIGEKIKYEKTGS